MADPLTESGFAEGDTVIVRGEYTYQGMTTDTDGSPFGLRPLPGARGVITEFEGLGVAIVAYDENDVIGDETEILTDLRCLQTIDFPQLGSREEVEAWLNG